jgi:two-component system, LytTR family, response regulator
MIRALIVDDESPARAKLDRWLREQTDIEVVGDAADGITAASMIDSLTPHVVFLDIQMPGMSGLEVAAQLEAERAPLVVFVTAFDEHAIKAFDLNAIDYLLKPYDKDRLLKSLARVRGRLNEKKPNVEAVRTARAQVGNAARLLVTEGERLVPIDADRIRWIEADDNYVHVHTAQRKHLLRRTLQDLLSQLGEERFVRIHKSAAVNLAEVHALEPLFKGDYEVVLKDGERLRMSRRYKDELFNRMGR